MTTRAQARDQVMGKTQAAAVKPTTVGIARTKMIINAVQRGIDCADTVHTLITARDSGDPHSQEIANRLMANKEFVKAMIAAVESILADVRKAAAAQPAPAPVGAEPTAGRPQPEGSALNGQDYPEANSPNNPHDPEKDKGSGLRGTDGIAGPLAAYSREASPPDIERRAADAAEAEAAQRRQAVLAHVKAVGSAQDIARVQLGLDRLPYEGE